MQSQMQKYELDPMQLTKRRNELMFSVKELALELGMPAKTLYGHEASKSPLSVSFDRLHDYEMAYRAPLVALLASLPDTNKMTWCSTAINEPNTLINTLLNFNSDDNVRFEMMSIPENKVEQEAVKSLAGAIDILATSEFQPQTTLSMVSAQMDIKNAIDALKPNFHLSKTLAYQFHGEMYRKRDWGDDQTELRGSWRKTLWVSLSEQFNFVATSSKTTSLVLSQETDVTQLIDKFEAEILRLAQELVTPVDVEAQYINDYKEEYMKK